MSKLNENDRATVLLKACQELLEEQVKTNTALNLLTTTIYYDDADCDGYCLLDDIRSYLRAGE